MKQSSRPFFIILTAVLLAAAALSACGKASSQPNSGTAALTGGSSAPSASQALPSVSRPSQLEGSTVSGGSGPALKTPSSGTTAAQKQLVLPKDEGAAQLPAATTAATTKKASPNTGEAGKETTKETTTKETAKEPAAVPSSYYARKILELTNAERAKAGLAPLTYSKALEDAAKIRVEEIKVKFSHTRPNGEPWSTVSPVTKGENLAEGPIYIRPADVMYGWMHSESHKKNILQPRFHTIGVAYSDGHWVQEFGV